MGLSLSMISKPSIVIKETKYTIWSKEQLKEVLLVETPEKKIEIEKLYSFCTKK